MHTGMYHILAFKSLSIRIILKRVLLCFGCSYETGNGIKVEESGYQKQISATESGTASRGSYSYYAPDGQLISVDWTADENGFQARGAHLPTPPPMPPHVVKMLADLRKAGRL